MIRRIIVAGLLMTLLFSCRSYQPSRSELVNRRLDTDVFDARIYKVADGQELVVHIFYPEGYSPSSAEPYPAAVSFHGGGWTFGPVEWGHGDAEFLASLGFVGVAVEYRLADSRGISSLDCMKDANSAIRWMRIHAADLNIDPGRIVTIGHSAGGHLALSTAFFPRFKEVSEDEAVSSVPNAVIALAPAVALDRDGYFNSLLLGRATAEACSPLDNVRNLELPVLIIQGDADELLPVEYTEEFVAAMADAGNDIRLYLYSEGSHGFFYESEEGRDYYQDIIRGFIRELDY